MKPKKDVKMCCPNCGATYDKEPTVMVPSGTIAMQFPERCKICRSPLIRKVTKHGKTKK